MRRNPFEEPCPWGDVISDSMIQESLELDSQRDYCTLPPMGDSPLQHELDMHLDYLLEASAKPNRYSILPESYEVLVLMDREGSRVKRFYSNRVQTERVIQGNLRRCGRAWVKYYDAQTSHNILIFSAHDGVHPTLSDPDYLSTHPVDPRHWKFSLLANRLSYAFGLGADSPCD